VSAHIAVVVPFPGLGGVVDDMRERTCVEKPSHGVPPHVTLLTPALDDVPGVTGAMAGFAAFDVRFERFDRFPGTLWLAPEPAERFVAMTEALLALWPGTKPYDGTFARIIPHLTVAQRDLDAAADELTPFLPLESRAESVVLLERVQPDHWRELATVELETA
jgi:2'-5' RNA ligase superfamily